MYDCIELYEDMMSLNSFLSLNTLLGYLVPLSDETSLMIVSIPKMSNMLQPIMILKCIIISLLAINI